MRTNLTVEKGQERGTAVFNAKWQVNDRLQNSYLVECNIL